MAVAFVVFSKKGGNTKAKGTLYVSPPLRSGAHEDLDRTRTACAKWAFFCGAPVPVKRDQRKRRTEREPESLAELGLRNGVLQVALVPQDQERDAPEFLGGKKALLQKWT